MAIKLDIAVRHVFPTLVAAVETPDAAPRNAELRERILARRATAESMQASNSGGWHSDRQIEEWGGKRVAEVLAMARSVATELTRRRDGTAVAPAWIVSAWANVNGPGDSNICHYHPGAFWSGTYYVDDGGAGDPSEALGGEFEMLDPRGPGPAMLAPTLVFAGEGGLSAGGTETIRPRPGLLFLFPSWLYHQVRAYRGSRERISIAFNLRV
jgi:uncharacterized protein (TIGR02466 family)